jgi:hypothetical protein
MATVIFVLLATAVIVHGAAIGKPLGWVGLGLAVLALLLQLVGPVLH